MSGALRNLRFPTMEDDGKTTVRVVCDLPKLRDLHSTMGGIRLIADGDGDNWKGRFELSADGRRIRCNQGHSAGSGVRPDVLPIPTQLRYLIRGTLLAAAQSIVTEGLSKCSRLHIHFYECDQCGMVLGGNTVRADQR